MVRSTPVKRTPIGARDVKNSQIRPRLCDRRYGRDPPSRRRRDVPEAVILPARPRAGRQRHSIPFADITQDAPSRARAVVAFVRFRRTSRHLPEGPGLPLIAIPGIKLEPCRWWQGLARDRPAERLPKGLGSHPSTPRTFACATRGPTLEMSWASRFTIAPPTFFSWMGTPPSRTRSTITAANALYDLPGE